MKALRQYGGKDMRLEDIPEPEPGPGEVKIKVKWCGICGSDVHEYQGLPGLLPLKRPHPGTGKMAPITGGHEFSGQVVKVGRDATHIDVGDRVTARATLPCFKCHYCKLGKHTLCDVIGAIGSAADGAFAELVVVPGDNVCRLPEEVTYEMAAFTEPLACAVHAVRRSRMEPGATVCVIGAGPIGLFTMQVALACGAGKVIVLEMLPKRSQLAKELGATEAIDPNEVNPEKAIAALTGGRRAEVVFECAGPSEAMLLAERVCEKGGTIVEVGVMLTPCNFPFSSLQIREKTIVASLTYTVDEFPVALSFLENRKVQCDPMMISGKIRLVEILEKGFGGLLGERRSDHCKILVSPE
jgi:(R,R)-butanediol dehydrogenase/meso-butanediol dehydrogenase/diacetyl reductase